MTDRGYTYTETFRHACEVRHIVNLPGPEERRAYLDGCERRRGKAAADRLRDDVRKAWASPDRGGATK